MSDESGENDSPARTLPTRTRSRLIQDKIDRPYQRLSVRCCARNCQTHFDDAFMERLKNELWTNDGHNPDTRKAHVRFQWEHYFTLDTDDKKVCKKFIRNVFQCSNNFLYYKNKTGENALRLREAKTVSVIAWFKTFQEVCDPIPNAEKTIYQVWCPHKKDVWDLYMLDYNRNPQAWIPVSRTHFLRVWQHHCKEFKLRKFLRFHKCGICTRFREVS